MATGSSSMNDNKHDSQGTITFENQQKLKYGSITDRALWFRGRLIHVSEENPDTFISGCTMVVLTVSDHGFPQCLMLCRHHGQEGDEEERRFWDTHSAVYSINQDRKEAYQKNKPNRPIVFHITDPSNVILSEDCFINYQHTWTLRDRPKVATIGKVQGEELARLNENYQAVQKSMYSGFCK